MNILIEPIPGKVFLYTYFPYGKSHCGPPFYPIKIDEFNVKNASFPKIARHYAEKTDNFHGCKLRVGVLNFYAPILRIRGNKLYGLEGSMLALLANIRNFTMNFTYLGEESYEYIEQTDHLVSFFHNDGMGKKSPKHSS